MSNVVTQPALGRAEIAARLRDIVGRVLRIEPAALQDEAPFLSLGADSLALVEVLRALHEGFGVTLAVRQLFEDYPTVGALAEYVETNMPDELPASPTATSSTAAPSMGAPSPAAPAPSVAASTAAAPAAPIESPLAALAAAPAPLPSPTAPPAAGVPAATAGLVGTSLELVMQAQLVAFNHMILQQMNWLRPGALPAIAAPATAAAAAPVAALAQSAPQPAPATPQPAASSQSTAPAAAPAATPAATLAATLAAAPAAKKEFKAGLSMVTAAPRQGSATMPKPPTEEEKRRRQAHLDALMERYTRKTAKSKQLAEASRRYLADSRAIVGFRPALKEMLYPLARERAEGSRLWDIDGHEYIDITMGMGVHLLGHKPEFLQPVLERQLKAGFELGPRSELAGEVAELLCGLTGMERAAFTNSGTEAVMTALRLARAATGREKIALFAGSYHGHSDGTLIRSQRIDGQLRSFPVAPGVPATVAEDVLVLDYGEPQALEDIRQHAGKLAAVVVEPVQSRRPDLQPREFLQQLRDLTREHGIALIFDEMITGFRYHLGGAQAYFGIDADLATYGKVIGGGLPLGAVAGKADFMDGIDGGMWHYGDDSVPERDTTFFGGTYCQHPLAMASGRATLLYLREQGPQLQARLNERTGRFAADLNEFFQQEGYPIHIAQCSSLFRFTYTADAELLFYHLVEKGIYVWEWRNCFFSTAHTEEDFQRIDAAIRETVAELRKAAYLP